MIKLKYDELKQAVDFMDKHLGSGGILYIKQDTQLGAVVFNYVSLEGTETNIELYDSERTQYPTIQERVWLHRKKK